MEEDLVLVITDKDHLCGRCQKLIPAGFAALKGEGEMYDARRGKNIRIEIYYHNPKCRPRRSRQIREPQIDPNVARRKRKKRW